MSENLLLTPGKIKKEPAWVSNATWVSAAWKKIWEMLVGCSVKKFNIIYTLDVSEDETVGENVDTKDSELKHDPEEPAPG